VVPYTFADLVTALNQVAPYDWASLLNQRVNSIEPRAPVEGIQRGGWRLVYTDKPNTFMATSEKIDERINLIFSLGFSLKKNGELVDVVPGSASYEAGIGPGMKLIAVNGRRWSREGLHDAIRQAQTSHKPMELIIENKQFYTTYYVPYYGGEKNPHLERAGDGPDLLTAMVHARAR
jgi:predicted metalloprotease with PDZ domain